MKVTAGRAVRRADFRKSVPLGPLRQDARAGHALGILDHAPVTRSAGHALGHAELPEYAAVVAGRGYRIDEGEPSPIRRRTGPWALAIGLVVVGVAAVTWLRSPARRRPSTLPAGATIIRERTDGGIYYLHMHAEEAAFEDWVGSMAMAEDPDADEEWRQWRGPDVADCIPIAVYNPEEAYGIWGAGCR